MMSAPASREVMSVRTLTDALGGSQRSGQQRIAMQRRIDAALLRFFCAAYVVEGNEARAAALVLRLVARDPDFDAPAWIRALFACHREALAEIFHRADHGRETDYAEGSESTGKVSARSGRGGRAGARLRTAAGTRGDCR